MNTGSRKHRAPFRPVDSLSSPQKPSFQTQVKRSAQDETENDSSFVEEISLSYLGDSSNLFEGDSFAASPQYVLWPLSHQILAELASQTTPAASDIEIPRKRPDY
jgi:hypothetical protein